jgi:hypothetical protein
MSRLSRFSIILAGLSLVATLGLSACERVPLLAPTGTVINLTLASDVAALNSSVDVIAVLIENGGSAGTGTGTSSSTTAAGTPVQNGTVVSFTTTIGTIEPAEAKTQNGRVNVKLVTNGQSGKATVTAYSGGAKSTAQITIGTAAVERVVTTASPANLSANGGSSTISARVEDVSGNPVAGIPVQFTTTKGTVSASSATTASNGIATTVLTTTATAAVTSTVASKTSDVTVSVATKGAISVSGPTTAVTYSSPATFTVTPGTTVALSNVVIDFGDGSQKSLGAPTNATSAVHFYSSSGIYTVTVAGTDADGVVATGSTQVAVTNLSGTVAGTNTAGSKFASFAVTVSGSTGFSIEGYEWNFGDPGSTNNTVTSTGASQTHVFSAAGTYTVTVTVVPAYGDSFTITTQIIIT